MTLTEETVTSPRTGKPARRVKGAAVELRIAAAEAALEHYDRDFYARRVKMREARKILKEQGLDLRGVNLSKLAANTCTWWRQERYAVKCRRSDYTWKEWQRMERWLRVEGNVDPDRDTMLSVTMRMRADGVHVTRSALTEAIKQVEVRLRESVRPFKEVLP